MKLYYIRASVLCICAAVLVSCGSEAETHEETAAAAVTSSSAATYLRTDVRPVEAPVTDSGDEVRDEDEYDEDEEEDPAPESGDVTDLFPDREDIDPKKAYTPDKDDLGSGRQVYAYPMNSLELSVYISPTDGSERETALLTGTEVTLYANVDFDHMEYWAYIGYEEGLGWCRANELTEVEPEHLYLEGVELPENRYIHRNYNEGVYYTAADGVEVKKSPSEGADIVGVLPLGEDVRAYGDSPDAEGWLFVGASAEYAEGKDGGFGEMFGWIDVQNGALTDSADMH